LNTVLIFVIIPLGFITMVSALVFVSSDGTKRAKRYRPGRPYDFQPVWYLASPEQVRTAPDGRAAMDGRAALDAPDGHRAQRALAGPVLEDISGVRVQPGPTGGASDSW
jgi:hypothetical protein